jgi:peptidoglycan/LPS O-acetylase OafA/YrhL
MPGKRDVVARLWPRLGIAGAGLLALVALVQHNPDWQRPYMQLIGFPGVAMFSTALVAYAITRPAKVLKWLPLERAGWYSYGFYLWHSPVLVLLSRATHLRGLPFMVSGAVVCSIPTLVSWVAVERPALLLKRFFPMNPGRERRLAADTSPAPATISS